MQKWMGSTEQMLQTTHRGSGQLTAELQLRTWDHTYFKLLTALLTHPTQNMQEKLLLLGVLC